MGVYSKIKRLFTVRANQADTPHVHAIERCVDLSSSIYMCSCGKSCIYINQVLTPLTFDNMADNDKGKTINGIYRF